MTGRDARICPASHAGHLDSRLRRWLQNPDRILRPYIRSGMTILEVGCGPGFFTVDMANMVGAGGNVVACDIQQEMLDRLESKLRGTAIAERVTLHRSTDGLIGWSGKADFILAFYVVHEIPDQRTLFSELHAILRPGGTILVVEPPLHVSAREFASSMATAEEAGFMIGRGPKMLFHKTALLFRR